MASSSPFPFPHKRRCPYKRFTKEDAESDSPSSYCSDWGLPALLMMIIRGVDKGVYISAGGHFRSYQFTNTCVPDSIMAALHFCYIKHPNIKLLLDLDISLRLIMNFLNEEKFEDAKALWMRQLKQFPQNKILDCKSRVQDHFPMFAKLVCAEVDFHQETPDDRDIYETTLSKFRALGDVKALGHADDPALILVNRDVRINLPKPPLFVEDDNKRRFELQFLLLGEGFHMVTCFNFLKNFWILYDDNPPFFRLFDFEQELDRYKICLAGYVNTTQAEVKLSITETGTEGSVEDVQMKLGNLSLGRSDSE